MGGFSSVNGDPLGTVMNADNVSFDGTSRGGVVTSDGQLLIGSTVTPHMRVANLTSIGGTVTILNGHGTINLEATTGSGFTWAHKSGNFNAVTNFGYTIVGGVITATLPPTSSLSIFNIGFVVTSSGSAGSLIIQANSGQTIQIGTNTSTVAGTATNTNAGDSIYLVYNGLEDKVWYAFGNPQGVWTLA